MPRVPRLGTFPVSAISSILLPTQPSPNKRPATQHRAKAFGLFEWPYPQQARAVESVLVRLLEAGCVFRISVPHRNTFVTPSIENVTGPTASGSGACFIHHVEHHVAHVNSTRVKLAPVGGENQFVGFACRCECYPSGLRTPFVGDCF